MCQTGGNHARHVVAWDDSGCSYSNVLGQVEPLGAWGISMADRVADRMRINIGLRTKDDAWCLEGKESHRGSCLIAEWCDGRAHLTLGPVLSSSG